MKDEIKVGDLITAYHKGYHIVTEVQERTKAIDRTDSPLIHYNQIVDSTGKPRKSKGLCCDAAFCRKVIFEDVVKQTKEAIQQAISLQLCILKALDKNKVATGMWQIKEFLRGY